MRDSDRERPEDWLDLPIYLRQCQRRSARRAEDLWRYLHRLVGRLEINQGSITAKIHDGRVVGLVLDAWGTTGYPAGIATRIGRLLAGSSLRYGTLTLRIKHGRLVKITPAPALTAAEIELLARFF